MKKFILPLLAFLLLFISCQKEPMLYCCGLIYNTHLSDYSFKKSDLKIWESTTFNHNITNDSLTISSSKNDLALKLNFKLADSAKTTTGYLQKEYETTFYQYNYTTSGKTLVYKLDSTANNTLRISTHTGFDGSNQSHQWLMGLFNLTFKLATPTGNMAFDTTRIYFPTGVFEIQLDK